MKYIIRQTINSLSLEEYDVNNCSVHFVENYNKEVIYTNEHHSITLQFPFIFLFILPSKPILKLEAGFWPPVISFADISTLRFTIIT